MGEGLSEPAGRIIHMELLLHFTIPFVMFSTMGLKPGIALALAVLAMTPDLDVLFMVHRSLSHSLFVWALCASPFFLLSWILRPWLLGTVCLGFAGVLSHLLLDLFSGYTPLLWPLYPNSLWFKAGLNMRIGSGVGFTPIFEVSQAPTFYRRAAMFDAPLFTSEGLMVSLALMSPLFIKLFIENLSSF